MNLLMISGDRSLLQGKKGAFWYTLEELSKHWDRIDIICPQSYIENPVRLRMTKPLNPEPLQTHFFENVFVHPSDQGLLSQSSWIMKKGKELSLQRPYSVMTVHDYPPFYNGRGAIKLSRSTGIPFVLEIHHIVGWPKAASLTERIGYWMSRLVLPRESKRASAIRTVNKEVKDQLSRWKIDRKKIHVVPSFYLDRDRLKKDSSIEKKYDLVFCGRLVANKGIKELLEAINLIPDISLLIIGDGSERVSIESLIDRLNLQSRVMIAGWLPTQEDVIKAIQSGKIFVMNSKSEGGPRVALEAMAIGMPVIVTKVGVMKDVINDGMNGVFTSGESADLVEKIRHLLGNTSARENLGQNAMQILDHFERRSLIKNYADFLKQHSLVGA